MELSGSSRLVRGFNCGYDNYSSIRAMKNTELANIFSEIADFLEIQGEQYKPRAYRRAARNIEALSEDIESIYERDELAEINGVGDALEEKIIEFLDTGGVTYYSELKRELPIDVDSLTSVEGIGPKSIKKLHDELGIETLEELETAAENGDIAGVSGFGPTSQQNILDHIAFAKRSSERVLFGKIFSVVESLEEYLQGHDEYNRVEVVGSFRRRTPTVGDLDILVTGCPVSSVHEIFVTYPDVSEVLARGDSRSSVRLMNDVQVDLRVVDAVEFGAALQYFTGSKEHNISMRNRAISRGWKLNEYGLFDESEEVIVGETETAVYEELGLSWVPPELREDTGEFDAAESNALPDLVELGDIRGDLQMHTVFSDGANSVLEMGENAVDLGYEYILITDHGPSLTVGNGISHDDYHEQRSKITAANEALDITILHGIEANITGNGLDVSREWLSECDLVVFSLHNQVTDPTDRIISVMQEYPVDILAHPQNRLLTQREGFELDFPSLMNVAEKHGIAIEINAQPDRLDLDWRVVKEYRDAVNYVISTDAHGTESLKHMELGVFQARKGWCTSDDILNTWGLDELLEWFDRA